LTQLLAPAAVVAAQQQRDREGARFPHVSANVVRTDGGSLLPPIHQGADPQRTRLN